MARKTTKRTPIHCGITGCQASADPLPGTTPPLAPGWGHLPGTGGSADLYLCHYHAPMLFPGLRG